MLFAVSIFALMGCAKKEDQKNVGTTNGCRPVDYKEGVYYFPCREAATFGNAVSGFLEKNKNLRILAVSGDGTGVYGYDKGYFVFIEQR